MFLTNTVSWTNWIFEVSTNVSPDNGYNSSDYIDLVGVDRTRIRYIRWKKYKMKFDEKARLYYKVIIK